MKSFIVFEGLDGAGKSTLLSEFKQLYPEYLQLYSVPDELSDIRKKVDKTHNPLAALHFFGLCNLLRSHEISEKISAGQKVVMDRYFFTTLAYQYLMLGDNILKYFEIILNSKQKILMPDLVIFVTARPEIISQRINQRDKDLGTTNKIEWYGDEISKKKSLQLQDAYIKFFEMFGVNYKIFDTSDVPLETMGQKLQEIL
ncbi:MAG: deoxynucleoside kinase [Raineya sp.]|nr:deoxynucleoside kinase [Raineya sp.]